MKKIIINILINENFVKFLKYLNIFLLGFLTATIIIILI